MIVTWIKSDHKNDRQIWKHFIVLWWLLYGL